MDSKEALEILFASYDGNYHDLIIAREKLEQDLDRLEQLEKSVEHYEATIKRWGEKYHLLEKELKQTKLNFRNSQTHSKNCYKKLKAKYKALETAYKNNEVLIRDNVKLINRNFELQDENIKLKKVFDILKNKFEVVLCESDFPIFDAKYSIGFKNNNDGVWVHISQKEYELVEEVFGYE